MPERKRRRPDDKTSAWARRIPAVGGHWPSVAEGEEDGWNSVNSHSWFSISERNLQHPSPLPSLPSSWSGEDQEPEGQYSGKAIKIFPDTHQKEMLRRAIGTYRWTYNHCVAAIKSGECGLTRKDLRSRFVNNSNFEMENTWVTDTPYEIRDQAMIDAISAFTSNLAKKRRGRTRLQNFDVKFKKKRAGYGHIKILKKSWSNGILYPRFYHFGPFRSSERLPPTLEADTHISLVNGSWYIWVPNLQSPRKPRGEAAKGRICAIDPGVRTFATIYDPVGRKLYKWGEGDRSRLMRLGLCLDDLLSRMAREGARRRYRMRRAANRLRQKLRNLVDELHKKFARWLAFNYEFIIMPSFNAHGMSRRGARRIGKKTVRQMMTWAHGRLRERLGWATDYIPCTEHYTSKACSTCGILKDNLGGAKQHVCSACGAVADRDCGGARNIFLKVLIESAGD